MIRIDAIKVNIYTNSGLFGRIVNFKNGLNIVKANNTSGKSSLFGAILYGLGFEEILGSRNDKALQSVFKSVVKEIVGLEGKTITSNVIQSEILLQITNGQKTITTKRYVVNEAVKPQAIEIYLGSSISEPDKEVERIQMYIHDAGGASNETIGFHKYLESFIDAKLPEIINQEGRRVKLFFPLIATAHFIEQKAGWSDFYANLPYYGIRDASAKVFEYILNFDVFETAAKRQENQIKLKDYSDKWTLLLNQINLLAQRGGAKANGISEIPQIMSKESKPYLRFLRAENSLLLSEIISSIKTDLESIAAELHTPLTDNLDNIENELSTLKGNTERYELLYENLSSELSQEKERLRNYNQQLKKVDEDIRKNKDAEKLQKLGFVTTLKITYHTCPTCNQRINDTLLADNLHSVPMRIEENIEYLVAQKKMIEAFISGITTQMVEMESRISFLEKAIQQNRSRIRSLKRTLISDDRLPSEETIERKVILERELSFLYRIREEFETLILELDKVGSGYSELKSSMVETKAYLSRTDAQKLIDFQEYFKVILKKFGFSSKPIETIGISPEKYLPVYEIVLPNEIKKQIDIRFESSASDFIRAEWAYYIALLNISLKNQGNHFGILVFDEPQQQSAANKNFKAFLDELEKFTTQQVIVFASFQNSEDDFNEATKDLKSTNIIDFTNPSQLFIQRNAR